MSGARRSIATTEMGANRGRAVVVAGGGIAGMAAATLMMRTGAAVTLLEQAEAIREVGAGLQVTPNGAAVLAGLGLAAEADARAIRARAVEPADALTGRTIARFDLTRLPGQPYRFFHRADLIEMLAAAAVRAGVAIRTAVRAAAITPAGEVTVAGAETLRPVLAIGADGLHSVARAALNPESAPFFTGQVAWRAVVAGEAAPVARIWMAPGRHVVTYPLPGGRINIVAVRESRDWTAEGWHHADDPANLIAAFTDCAPDLRAILRRVEEVRLWGLFRHPVAACWHGTGTALVGDAAHPTLPFLAQGANLALEDAWVLAATTDADPSLDRALAQYQALRRARVIRALDAANANAVNYHLSGARRAAAHAGLRAIGTLAPGAFLRRLDWLYAHDVTQARPLRLLPAGPAASERPPS